jgi:TDG/mug DNA glycosylase family protein
MTKTSSSSDGEITLPDWIGPGLDVLSIGINPSIYSVRVGFPFARPQNRFWKALNASRLVGEELVPGRASMDRLLARHRIGFTDVVKRATSNASQLSRSDFERDAPLLLEKLRRFRPRIAWLHGRTGFDGFARAIDWEVEFEKLGEQPERCEGAIVFVTPNPSPANAHASLDDLVAWYRQLALLRDHPR